MKLPNTLLFDLNDTILLFEYPGYLLLKEMTYQHAETLSIDGDTFWDAVKKSNYVFWKNPEKNQWGRLSLATAGREILCNALGMMGIEDQPLVEQWADHFALAREEVATPFEGAVELLQTLKANGHKLALIANGNAEMQRLKMNKFRLVELFDVIVLEGDFGIGKPNHDGFLHILKTIDSSPQEAMMIGNTFSSDIVPAHELGMQTVWVNARGQALPDGATAPTHTISVITELLTA